MSAERQPIVAGQFYPEDDQELATQVSELLGPGTVSPAPAIATIVPSAALHYSGHICGQVFARVEVPTTTILICPNHTGRGQRVSIMTRGSWRIPGASIPIDSAVADELGAVALLTDDLEAHEFEHAIEVQLPFLRHRNPRARIVPVCLGEMNFAACVRIGHAIADVVVKQGRDVLVVASAGLSQYLEPSLGAEADRNSLELIQSLKAEELYKQTHDRRIPMSGLVPITVGLVSAHSLQAAEAELIAYEQCVQTHQDRAHSVGYAGVLLR
ncbi:MAG: AmmeMemoRadiSam system protein B [Myxococcota bacterium]